MNATSQAYLTVREVAEILRVKERKVYALAAEGRVPCSRAMGKLLFPREAIEKWLAVNSTGLTAAKVESKAEAPLVFAGSHDPLLDWAIRESQSGIASFFDGSLDGLARMADGRAAAAGTHLHEADGDGWNDAHIARALGELPVVSFEWAWRERGVLLAPSIDAKVRGIRDLKGLRVMPRQSNAGSQCLFEELVAKERVAKSAFAIVEPPARTETDLALAIVEGRADAGFGLESAARQFRLRFAPVIRERYDIVVLRKAYFDAPFQRLLAFCRSEAFRERAASMGGYDVSSLGAIRFNAPA